MEFLDGLQLLSGDDTISLTISPDQLDGNKKLSFSINSISHIRFYDPVTFPKTITNFLKDQLQAMIAKILKNSHSNFQSIEVYISDTNSSNRINVNFPKSKMTIWLDTFTLHDFLKLVKDFKFVFDSKEKKNFGFDSSKYHNKFPRLKTGDSKFDFIISDSNDIYYYDREYNIHIYVLPEVGTQIIHSTEHVIVTFLENNEISVSRLTLEDLAKRKNAEKMIEVAEKAIEAVQTKETKEKKLKYLFVREDISTTNFKDYGVDRVVNRYGQMCWLDEVTNHMVTLLLKNFTFFDENTQKNIEIYKYKIHPQDSEARVVLYSSIKDESVKMRNEIDFILYEGAQNNTERFPDGEYTDYITKKKFEMKNGTVVLPEKEKKYEKKNGVVVLPEKEKMYWVYDGYGYNSKQELSLLNICFKDAEKYLIKLSQRKQVELNENGEIVETDIEIGFTFIDEISKNKYTFIEGGYNVITN